ncbi:MAG TPA: tripartite tricarboxylate transporter substrate binding protein [Burkholderiales bacterium]|jgi:tripartite-type tricarboxylate transporter receptor subunit TctC
MRLLLLLLIALTVPAWGQTYPSKPVRVIVTFPPGSTPDIVGRALASRLQESMGQPFVVENRAGAGGNIGADAVAKASPDGYTLLVSTNGVFAINKALYKTMPFDPDKDLAPLSLLATAPQMLVVQPSLGLKDFKGFVEYAKRNPGKLSYGSVGAGSASHLTMELLKSDAGVDLVHVPYKGFPPAVTDMLAGNIQAMFAIVPGVLAHVKAGKMTALAVTALKRSSLAPDVPSVAELGLPQLESLAWIGLAGPAGLSPVVVDRITTETARGMRRPELRELLGKQGFDVVAGTPQEFSRWIQAESAKWARVVRLSGATAE